MTDDYLASGPTLQWGTPLRLWNWTGNTNTTNTYTSSYHYTQGGTRVTCQGGITTRVIQTAQGWVGQVVVDDTVVHDARPRKSRLKALTAINAYVTERLGGVFTDPPKADEPPTKA